jgi:hypothetical protein
VGRGSACALILGSLAVALAACESDRREAATTSSPPPTTAASTVGAEPTTTAAEPEEKALPVSIPRPLHVLDGVHPVGRPASRHELAWLGKFTGWWAAMQGDLVTVAAESDAITRGEHEGEDEDSDLRQALDRLAHCETELSQTIPPTPTARLRRLDALLTDACFALEQVAHSGSQMIVNGASASFRASWPGDWEAATHLLYRATRRITAYDPALELRLPRLGGVRRESRIEPLFSRVASRLAGKRVRVQCWEHAQWPRLARRESLYSARRISVAHLGFAAVGGDVVNLSPDVCDGLVVLAYARLRPTGARSQLALALSVDALSHEPLHSRGIANEAVTECFAMQRIERTARLLHVEQGFAQRLGDVAWKRGYRLGTRQYRSPECRDGGALDLRPGTSRWPS